MSLVDKSQTNSEVRKAYKTPHLEVYGNLGELTQTVTHGVSAVAEGGANPNHFTTS